MAPEEAENNSVEEQARYWLVRRHSGEFTPAENFAFEHWLDSDTSHAAEYGRQEGLWGKLEEFKHSTFPARTMARNYRSRTGIARFPPRHQLAGLGLGLILIIGLFTVGRSLFDSPVEFYQTMKGEQKVIALADGSQAELNTDTTLRVVYTREGRIIRLESGEALFTVNHDDDRPFDVITGAGRIRDIGTRFNVYKQPDDTVTVSVQEGSVSVTTDRSDPTVLVQGDRVTFTANGLLSAREHIDPTAATAWREGRVIFARTPLSEVMSQLARYHDIEFTFASPEVAQLRLSGTFGTRDLPLFLHTLTATLPVEARIDGKAIRLASARPSTSIP